MHASVINGDFEEFISFEMEGYIMKKVAGKLLFVFLFVCFTLGFTVSVNAAEKGYSIGTGNTRVYSNTMLTNGYGWIYASDEVTINQITSGYLKVTYPVSRGTKTGYIKPNTMLIKTSGWGTYTSRAKITTYKRPFGVSYGYISRGDQVRVIGTNGSYIQVKYPVSGGYKYAFIRNSDYNSYIAPVKKPSISYSAHSAEIGWQSYVSEGKTAGTTGQGRRMEGLKIKTTGTGIQYRAHVQNIGWQNWVSNNSLAGTTGKSLQMEAIQIKLTGTDASNFDIYYRVHSADKGWLGWAANGESAGTQGGSLRMEAIQITMVAKGASFNRGGTAFYDLTSSANNQNSGTSANTGGTVSDKRVKVVNYMKAMAQIKWTPKTTFTHWSGGRNWTAGIYYYGIPYSQSCRNTTYEQFIAQLNGSTYVGPAKQSTYMGSDCSSAVSIAWKQADSGFTIRNTSSLQPGNSKITQVGNYTYYSSYSNKTKSICASNGKTKMFEAYRNLLPGDAVVERNGSGHVMLIASVNKSGNSVMVIEQTTYDAALKSTWRVNKAYSFDTLYNSGYIPIRLSTM